MLSPKERKTESAEGSEIELEDKALKIHDNQIVESDDCAIDRGQSNAIAASKGSVIHGGSNNVILSSSNCRIGRPD